MTLKYALASAALSLVFTVGCPEDNDPVVNYDALPDIGQPDSATGDTPVNTDTPGADTPQIDITTDVDAPLGTVKALQLKAEGIGCDVTQIQTIAQGETLTGVIVTSPKYDAFTPTGMGGTALDGYFVADTDGGQWSGIHITIPRDDATDYQPGDLLDLSGELTEFYCQTQLSVSTHSTSGSSAAPVGLEVPPAQVAVEAFEGMLLTVKGVEVTDEIAGGTYRMTGGFIVDHAFDFFLTLDPGVSYDITGVLMYTYNEYRLMPRTEADIVADLPTNTVTIDALQTSAASTDCGTPGINGVTDGLTLEGYVAVGNHYVTDNLDGYFLTTSAGGANSGVMVTVASSSASDWAVGDEVRLVGEHMEFYCNTQFSADSFEVLSTGNTVPGPWTTDVATIMASPEQYEGVLVEVSDVTIAGVTNFNEGNLDGAGLYLDNDVMGLDFPDLVDGTSYSTVIGVIVYAFSEWRIAPRSAADMLLQATVDAGPETAPDAGSGDTGATTDAAVDSGPDAPADGGAMSDAAAD